MEEKFNGLVIAKTDFGENDRIGVMETAAVRMV